MVWMVDLRGISNSKYVLDTTSSVRPSFRHIRPALPRSHIDSTKQVNLVFGQSDMMRLMDPLHHPPQPIVNDSIFRAAVSTPPYFEPEEKFTYALSHSNVPLLPCMRKRIRTPASRLNGNHESVHAWRKMNEAFKYRRGFFERNSVSTMHSPRSHDKVSPLAQHCLLCSRLRAIYERVRYCFTSSRGAIPTMFRGRRKSKTGTRE